MRVNKVQARIAHNTIEEEAAPSNDVSLSNLQTHLAALSQLPCISSLIHQPSIMPTSSSILLNSHLYFYMKSKKADYNSLNQAIIDSLNTSNKAIKEMKDQQRDLINEINWITQEKIDSINEKEKLDEELEAYHQLERQSKNAPMTAEAKKKKLKELKGQYAKMAQAFTQHKRAYDEMQVKNSNYSSDNRALIEKIKQKRIIYDQVVTDVNEFNIALSKHKKLMSIASKDTQDSSSTTSSNKRTKSNGLFKKLFK